MASIEQTDKSPNYYIRFRYLGRNINRSLGTPNRRTAAGICSRVEETLRLLDAGRITISVGIDPVEFILSDGRVTKPLSTSWKNTWTPTSRRLAGLRTSRLS